MTWQPITVARLEGNTGGKDAVGKKKNDFQTFLMKKFHSAHLTEINIECNKQEYGFDSDANGGLVIKTCYILSYSLRQYNK